MDVHHHPDIRKKNLKEYIFEGLMIFMAVTLGFFAEKIRENHFERKKEKEYIASMIQDAHLDIVNVEVALFKNKSRILYLDSLAFFCFNYDSASSQDKFFYKVMVECIRHPYFVSPVERTLSQLKNAGEMRLIDNPIAVDSIVFYEDAAKKLVNQQAYYELHLNKLVDAIEQTVNMKNFPLNAETYKWIPNTDGFQSAQLINHDSIHLIELGNKTKMFQGIVIYYVVLLEQFDTKAKNLISTLKKEYNFK